MCVDLDSVCAHTKFHGNNKFCVLCKQDKKCLVKTPFKHWVLSFYTYMTQKYEWIYFLFMNSIYSLHKKSYDLSISRLYCVHVVHIKEVNILAFGSYVSTDFFHIGVGGMLPIIKQQ